MAHVLRLVPHAQIPKAFLDIGLPPKAVGRRCVGDRPLMALTLKSPGSGPIE
jgi:hypothetical protein